MKRVVSFLAVAFTALTVLGQGSAARYPIAFYSVENLFDTIKNPGTMDDEFTPGGSKRWDTQKYRTKMGNLERALYAMSASLKDYPAVIGLSEVENRGVLEELVSQPKLRAANYQIAHYDSPDPRGIDVALLYRPEVFNYHGSHPIQTRVPLLKGYRTRDILSVWGTVEGERFCFFVCHWASQRGEESTSEVKRLGAARTLRVAADSIMRLRPDTKMVMMGDFNDDPLSESLRGVLGARVAREQVARGGYYNPYGEISAGESAASGDGESAATHDAMIVNFNLMNPDKKGLKLVRGERGPFLGNTFDAPMLKYYSGARENTPIRTFSGNVFMGGYSSHYPVYIFISKDA